MVSYCCHFVKGAEEFRGDRPRNPQGNFTANIPEPTSGLLLLLSVAGLALKRKLA